VIAIVQVNYSTGHRQLANAIVPVDYSTGRRQLAIVVVLVDYSTGCCGLAIAVVSQVHPSLERCCNWLTKEVVSDETVCGAGSATIVKRT